MILIAPTQQWAHLHYNPLRANPKGKTIDEVGTVNALVIGNGAREHAISWKLAQSPIIEKVYCAPGNAGTPTVATNVDISATDFDQLASFVKERSIGLIFVGPEAPLVAGISDYFAQQGVRVFGPSKKAAQIEGSKAWAKDLMIKYGIPTAMSKTFDSYVAAREYVLAQPLPMVIKADGLAAGKGVIIATQRTEALEALSLIMEQKAFGSAGDRVIIEECLQGPEVSVLALSDGETVVALAPACDYKRALDNDKGPNTGGMGSYCPTRMMTPELMQQVTDTILIPTVRGLAAEGARYVGILYAGLMLTANGPKVLEYNCRFGDPETQAVLPLLKSDLAKLALATIEGRLAEETVEWQSGACCGVVLASGGYPGDYATGYPISGLDKLANGTVAFHAGTKLDADGQIVTAGGRVLTVVATGATMAEARAEAYRNVEFVQFEGRHYRHDIALRETN
jgi:phosphoribosylamine--glycine ligase